MARFLAGCSLGVDQRGVEYSRTVLGGIRDGVWLLRNTDDLPNVSLSVESDRRKNRRCYPRIVSPAARALRVGEDF